jgi:hypothetical protein
MLPNTPERVPRHTPARLNRAIHKYIDESVRRHAAHPERIDRRLAELDSEWDIERTLEANAAMLAFTGVVLGVIVDKRWLALPAAVTAFLLQHALQGWCPPVPVLRKLYALKALRGDFGPLGPNQRDRDSRASHALQAARL